MGAAAVFLLQPAPPVAGSEAVRDIVDVPVMSVEAADQHRDEQYQRLTTIQEVVALPTEFARAEAAHALAGRSDSATLQGLVFEATRLANEQQRESLLNILFFRLSEADPRSALALSRDGEFDLLPTLQRTVWMTWAQNDLDAAIFEAKTQTSVTDANKAAQSLYAAFGFMGNATTERIEAELGIAPDRATRARYIYRKADRSPPDTIEYINNESNATAQREYTSWLAYYLSMDDAIAALGYANLFEDQNNRARYRSILNQIIARANPRLTLDRLLASDATMTSGMMREAAEALSELELDVAMEYYQATRNRELRQSLGQVVANKLAKQDVEEALIWARANDGVEFPYLEHTVISYLATTDPEAAMREAAKSYDPTNGGQLLGTIVGQISRSNPATVVAFLEQMEPSPQRNDAEQRLAMTWMRQDASAAMDWILTRDEETRGRLVQSSIRRLADSDVDAAIRMLPLLDDAGQIAARQQIVQQLASSRSTEEAQDFVRQFEGQAGHDQLLTSMIYGIARRDPSKARQLVEQLPRGTARDQAYSQLLTQQARSDPAAAARMLGNVSSEPMQAMAATQIAAQWYRADAAAATRWANQMQPGPVRDSTIIGMARHWNTPNAAQIQMIESIQSREKRSQAKIQRIYGLLQTNPGAVQQLLEDKDFTDEQRAQLEQMMVQYGQLGP